MFSNGIFLRWPGGKRWLWPFVERILEGVTFERYVEPFLGGGAIFFCLRPPQSLLSDRNEELITTYRMVRDFPAELVDRLKKLPVNEKTYNRMRKKGRGENELEIAVRFLYLNRTAFSGMYRVNQKGEFNVPFGGGERTTEILWKTNLIFQASQTLKNTKLDACMFESTLERCGEGDLVYCDPAYTVTHNNNGFRRYNDRLFSWADQIHLASLTRNLADAGAIVIISNACHPDVEALYPGAKRFIVRRNSLVSRLTSSRRPVEECVFVFGKSVDRSQQFV